MAYNGADNRDVQDLLGNAGIEAAFLFDAPSQTYRTFFFGRPAFLSDFTVIDRLDAVFLFRP